MNINKTLENLRISYQQSSLEASDCHENPLDQFQKWLKEAIDSRCDEPNAFVLSTAINNEPRSRVVLLKGVSPKGLVFYTNYESDKGNEIKLNKKVSMNFLWLPLQRQVRIEGHAFLVDAEVSDKYFNSRPRGSQLGAIASPQSQIIESRESLEIKFNELEKEYSETDILKRPENWGGYEISPLYFEFWQGRNNRLHDRVCYKKCETGWDIFRRAP